MRNLSFSFATSAGVLVGGSGRLCASLCSAPRPVAAERRPALGTQPRLQLFHCLGQLLRIQSFDFGFTVQSPSAPWVTAFLACGALCVAARGSTTCFAERTPLALVLVLPHTACEAFFGEVLAAELALKRGNSCAC